MSANQTYDRSTHGTMSDNKHPVAEVISLALYRVRGIRSDEEYRRGLLEEFKRRIHSGPPMVHLCFERTSDNHPREGSKVR